MAGKQIKRSVKTNAILNIIKQCCNIVFPLITYPYVSRIIGASSLGRYSFADSIMQYAIILATLGVSGYAIREGARVREDKVKINQFANEILSINVLSLIISCIFLVILVISIERVRKEYILLLILSINMFTTVFGRDWINSIYEDFVYITLRYIIFQVVSIILMFILVKNPDDVYKYAFVVVIGTAGAQIANIIHTLRIVPISIRFNSGLRKHIKPILFMFCISVASIIYINSDITILGFLRSKDEVGTYYLVGKIYTIIKALMNAVIMVSIPRLSYYLGNNDRPQYNSLLNSLKNYLYTLLIPSITGLFMLSENVLKILGGHEYLGGITAFRTLCGAMLFAVFGSFYAHGVLIPNRKESVFFLATIISALANIGLNFVFIPYMGISGAAVTTLLSEIIVVGICYSNARGLYKSKKMNVLPSVIAGSISVVFSCLFIRMLKLNCIAETVVSILVSVFVYTVVTILLKNEIVLSIVKKIRKYLTGFKQKKDI